MKKWGLLFCYIVYVIILLFYSSNPARVSLVSLLTLLVIPASLLIFPLAIYALAKSKLRWLQFSSIAIIILVFFQFSYILSFNWSDDKVGDFEVLSINASFFKVPTIFSDEYFNPIKPNRTDSLVNWIIDQRANFLLIEEFIDDEKSDYFNILQNIQIRGGYKDYYFINDPQHDNGVSRGLIIFSKWKIVEKNQIFLGENRFNGAQEIVALIAEDTIRLVNVHLQSTELNLRGGLRNEFGRFLRDGKIKSDQIDLILNHLSKRRVPTIIAGDFNSTRYSYVHKYIKRHDFQNAFEKVGTGFGFSFKGSFGIPVKIDHQYFNEGLVAEQIIVEDSLKISDHFPIIGRYSFNR